MFEAEESHFNTSPISSQNDGLSSSYKSSLPRCAVVNFTKDGHLIKWTPRARENTGGMAARVRDFDDAFQLEELSSRTFAFSNPRLPIPDTKVPAAPKDDGVKNRPGFDLSTALTQAALHGNLSINPPKLSRRKKWMKFLFRRQRKTLHRQESDAETSIFLSGIGSEDRADPAPRGGKLFKGRSLEERSRPRVINTGGSEDSSGVLREERTSERTTYQGDGQLQLYDEEGQQVRSRGFGGLFRKEQQLQLIDPDLIANATLNGQQYNHPSWMCWKPQSDAKVHNHPRSLRPYRASADQYIQFMDEF